MGTIIVGAVIFGVSVLAAYRVYQNHKKGKCCGCAYKDSCGQNSGHA